MKIGSIIKQEKVLSMREPKRFIPKQVGPKKELKVVVKKPTKPETFFCVTCKNHQPIHSQIPRDWKYKSPYMWDLYKDTCKWCQIDLQKTKVGKAAFEEARRIQSRAPSRKDRAAIKKRLRSLVSGAMRRNSWDKESETFAILGADADTVHNHLKAGCIARYGKYDPVNVVYEIDHETPMSSARTYEEAHALNHYLNLQLLTKEENRRKSDKVGKQWGNENSFLLRNVECHSDDEDISATIVTELAEWLGNK